MKKLLTLTATAIFLSFTAACSNSSAETNSSVNKTENKAAAPVKEENIPSAPTVSVAKPMIVSSSSEPDTGEPVKFPYADFPAVETTAKAGDFVLVPSYNWLQDAATKGVDSTNFIWYTQKLAAPDKANSEVQFMSQRKKVPNAYIVAIPAGQKAQKGDIVLTWWQTGSGMQRAIVVDDADPISPVVRYLDIDYTNPAKSSDKSTTIGKMDEKIMPDTFVKLKDWDAGTMVAIQDGANIKAAQLIRAAGDKILVLEGVGKLKVYPKASAKPIPLVPDVKTGDRVKAPQYGDKFANGTVSSVDAKIGRVFIKFDGSSEEKAVSFGEILKG